MTSLICPKCHGSMRQYERNGIHVDQCQECRGVFLDRGELEQLIDGEQRWAATTYGGGAPQATPAPPHGYQGKPYKKRKNFLEELFD